METKFIEAIEKQKFNWGKFMLCRFTPEEWSRQSALDAHNMLASRGWCPQHILVVDLQTGEGAVFMHGGMAQNDLNEKHQIWVCPMFEPFLVWLYQQDISDFSKLPGLVNLGDVPVSMSGYRRKRKADVKHK